MTLSTLTAALLLALGDGAAPAPAKDPAALALLRRMCDRLQAAKTFTVRGRVSLELPLADGTLATFTSAGRAG